MQKTGWRETKNKGGGRRGQETREEEREGPKTVREVWT